MFPWDDNYLSDLCSYSARYAPSNSFMTAHLCHSYSEGYQNHFEKNAFYYESLMPYFSHHSDAIWILVLPEPQLVPVSSVSWRVLLMLVWTFHTLQSDSQDLPKVNSTLKSTRNTSWVSTSLNTWTLLKKKMKKNSRNTSLNTSRYIFIDFISLLCIVPCV